MLHSTLSDVISRNEYRSKLSKTQGKDFDKAMRDAKEILEQELPNVFALLEERRYAPEQIREDKQQSAFRNVKSAQHWEVCGDAHTTPYTCEDASMC